MLTSVYRLTFTTVLVSLLSISLFLTFSQTAQAATTSVSFSKGDVIGKFSIIDKSGFSVAIEDYVVDLTNDTFILGNRWDTYLAILSDGRMKVRAEDYNGSAIFQKDPFRRGGLKDGDVLDIYWHVDESHSYITINGVTTDLAQNTGTTTYKMPKNINSAVHYHLRRSGNFDVSSINYLDGAGNTVFFEDGNAADWNRKLTRGLVTNAGHVHTINEAPGDFVDNSSTTPNFFDLSDFSNVSIKGSLDPTDQHDIILIELPRLTTGVSAIDVAVRGERPTGVFANFDTSTGSGAGIINLLPNVANNPCDEYCAGGSIVEIFTEEPLDRKIDWEIVITEVLVF